MLLGSDVTHPSPGSTLGTPSIAAVVGSTGESASVRFSYLVANVGQTDGRFAQYPVSLRLQTSRQEVGLYLYPGVPT